MQYMSVMFNTFYRDPFLFLFVFREVETSFASQKPGISLH